MNTKYYVLVNNETHKGKIVKLTDEEATCIRKLFVIAELDYTLKIPNEVRFLNWLVLREGIDQSALEQAMENYMNNEDKWSNYEYERESI